MQVVSVNFLPPKVILQFALLASLMLLLDRSVAGQLFTEEARSWISLDGKSRVIGSIGELTPDLSVVTIVRADNGKQVAVPLERLSALDYLYVQDYARRSKTGEPESLMNFTPMATSSGFSRNDRWLLRPAISIALPIGTTIWKLISAHPVLYGAFFDDADEFPVLSVYYDSAVPEISQRLERIKEQNEATLRFLRERQVTGPEGSFFQEQVDLSFQKSILQGVTNQGEPLICESHLRFGPHGMLVFRAYGSSEQVQRLVSTIDDFRYLDDEPAEPAIANPLTNNLPPDYNGASGAGTSPVNTSNVPLGIRNDFQQFLTGAIDLLRRPNNAKQVLEALVRPEELVRLKQDPPRWDNIIIAFDVRKRDRLILLLQSLDWATASYSAEDRALTFTKPNSVEFVQTEVGWRIVN